MEFRILGPLEVVEDGRPLPLAGQKQRALLGALLLHANEVVSNERLIDALWGERPPETAQTALQVHVSQLRKLLGAKRIVTRAPGYLIQVAPEELDLAHFERLGSEGRAHEALALWRGEPLQEFSFDSFAQSEIARLEELRLATVEQRIEQDLAAGREVDLIAELESLVRTHPLRERLRGQLMLALYRCGRQADALQLYHETRRLLVEELGIEPGPELQQLERRILNQDESLAAPVAAPAPQEPAPREERKVVSVVFADLVGFTARAEQLDPEDVSALLSRYHVRLRAELERHGGTVEKFVGDAVMALFGAPVAHEDDPERAVRAALGIRDWIAEQGEDLQVRIAVNTGPALVRLGARPAEGEGMAMGDVVNTASRLQQAAPVDAVLVGEATYRATRDSIAYERVDSVEVKGKAEPVPVWIAKDVRSASADTERPTTPLVGREDDLALLQQTYARALRESSAQLVTIVGEPGIGKTRLVTEFRALLEAQPHDLLVRHGRCLAYGDGITFWALGQIVKEHAAILESDTPDVAWEKLLAAVTAVAAEGDREWLSARLAPLVGASREEASVEQEEAFAAWRTFLEAVAAQQPLVLLVEDLHWADTALLGFLDQLVEWIADVPLLVVATARPELYERSPDWGGGKRNTNTIALAPLSDADTTELVSELLADATLPNETQQLLLERAGGNPLYAEEFVRMLSDRGLLVRRAGTTELAPGTEIPVPESVQAVIAARLDTLPAERKELVHAAAVVGKVFWGGALAAITRTPKESVLASLHELGRKELVRRVRNSSVEDDVEYLFWHVLVRDVAYAQIPRGERARKHVAAAEWIERIAGERVTDHAEFLAHHYSRALELLGATETAAPSELQDGAIHWIVAAGDRAFQLDVNAARTHYERALELMPAMHPGRARLLPKLGSAFARVGELGRADAMLTEGIDEAIALGDQRLELVAMIERASWRLWTDPWSIDEARAVAERAIRFFDDTGDAIGLAKAWHLLADVESNWRANTEALERALVYARRAGDRREEADILWWLAVSLYFGPTPADAGIRRCEEILEEAGGDRAVEAGTLGILAGLYAMRGRFSEARELFARGISILEELGIHLRVASRRTISGAIELLADDPSAAERELLWGFERLEEMGEHQDLPGIAAQLTEALYRQGRYEEAEAFAAISEAEEHARMRWRSPRAKLLARRGELERAEEVARAAAQRAGQADNLNSYGNTLMDLAEVLRLAGRGDEAVAPLHDALRVYGEKGNIVAASKARAVLKELSVPAR